MFNNYPVELEQNANVLFVGPHFVSSHLIQPASYSTAICLPFWGFPFGVSPFGVSPFVVSPFGVFPFFLLPAICFLLCRHRQKHLTKHFRKHESPFSQSAPPSTSTHQSNSFLLQFYTLQVNIALCDQCPIVFSNSNIVWIQQNHV